MTKQTGSVVSNTFMVGLQSVLTFVVKQRCVPWRVRCRFNLFMEEWLRKRATALYRLIRFGSLNINTRPYWNLVWEQEKTACTRNHLALFDEIARAVPESSTVLDTGCGVGLLLRRLRDDKRCKVYGLDLSDTANREVKLHRVPAVVADVRDLPFRSAGFDVVIATELLEHLSNPRAALRAMAHVLKEGGLLIASVPNNRLHPHEELEHMHSFDESALRSLISRYLDVVEIRTIGLTNTRNPDCLLAFARKPVATASTRIGAR